MDIVSLLTEYDSTKIDSRYRLVIIASQRARQLMQGSKPLITSKFTKAPTIGLDEVLQGKTEFVTGKEAKVAIKEDMQARALQARTRPKMPARIPVEDESEIKKDLGIYVNDRKEGEVPPAEPEG